MTARRKSVARGAAWQLAALAVLLPALAQAQIPGERMEAQRGTQGGSAPAAAPPGPGTQSAQGGERGTSWSELLRRMNAGEDAKISRSEFMKHYEEVFAKLDSNRDGALDRQEMRVARDLGVQ